jgi:hypothetical protein
MGATAPVTDIREEVRRVLDGGATKGFTLRELGGLAIHLDAPSELPEGVQGTYKDIDFVTTKRGDRGLAQFMRMGLCPAKHAQRRASAAVLRCLHQRQLDVFVARR